MPELADALDLALEIGAMAQESGGHTTRTVDLMTRMAEAMGATQTHCAVSSINVSITVGDGVTTLTGGRHAEHFGINFSQLSAAIGIVDRARAGRLGAGEVRFELAQLRRQPPVYPVWLVMLALGGSSAAFAILFGTSIAGAVLTFLGGWAGGWTRQLLVRRHQKPFVAVTSAAFVSALIVAAGAVILELGDAAQPALAASTLFLVPGVPLLNGTADLLTAHYLNGVTRLAMSAVIVASASVGLTAAVTIAGLLE